MLPPLRVVRRSNRNRHCSQEEADEATLEEAAEHGDLIFVPGTQGTDYRSIVYKTFALVQWVARHSQPRFVLKTDDDAYVHTANLVASLQKVLRVPAAIRLPLRGVLQPGLALSAVVLAVVRCTTGCAACL